MDNALTPSFATHARLVMLGLDRVADALGVANVTELSHRAPSLETVIDNTASKVLRPEEAAAFMAEWKASPSSERVLALDREFLAVTDRLKSAFHERAMPMLIDTDLISAAIDFLRFEHETCPCLSSLENYHVFLHAAEDNYRGLLCEVIGDCNDETAREIIERAYRTLGKVAFAELIVGPQYKSCAHGCLREDHCIAYANDMHWSMGSQVGRGRARANELRSALIIAGAGAAAHDAG